MVVAVEGGVVAGGSDIFGGAFDDDGRVGLREGCRLAGSGLDSAALLVLVFWCRRRSVEEGPKMEGGFALVKSTDSSENCI